MPSGGSKDFDVMKWWLKSRDNIDDVVDKDIAQSCARKDGYRSEPEARAHIAMNNMQGKLFTYHCRYCDFWHLTKRQS
jgi:hypothetical protein